MEKSTLEADFIEELTDSRKPCECGVEDCEGIIYYKQGTKVRYRIDFDPKDEYESNVYISMVDENGDKLEEGAVAFNGRCRNNMDFAKVLSMVII